MVTGCARRRRRLITYLGLLCAPVVMIVMFAVGVVSDGDNPWTEATLRPIMLVGVCGGLLMGLMMASLDHNATLGAASEAVHVRDSLQSAQAAARPSPAAAAAPLPASAAAGDDRERWRRRRPRQRRACSCVRSSIFIYDVLRLLSGGLVVKYWGLFFKEAYGLGPVAVLGIALGTIISMLALTLAAGFLSGQRVGAGRGAVCFGLLLLCDSFNFATVYARTCGQTPRLDCARGLNGVFGLKKAILMDHTPKSRRGVWNAVDNLQSGFFSGSAIVVASSSTTLARFRCRRRTARSPLPRKLLLHECGLPWPRSRGAARTESKYGHREKRANFLAVATPLYPYHRALGPA